MGIVLKNTHLSNKTGYPTISGALLRSICGQRRAVFLEEESASAASNLLASRLREEAAEYSRLPIDRMFLLKNYSSDSLRAFGAPPPSSPFRISFMS